MREKESGRRRSEREEVREWERRSEREEVREKESERE